ncbi:MAG: hypothetical protein QM516_06920 [Limnohabitans sp.]|jgi:hypothetical protein|nr:hypothetical protein [Limnohabitans sp.]
MPRREGPALYELLGSKGSSEGPTREPSRRISGADLRALLVIVMVFAALTAGYLIGHARGERVGRAASALAESDAEAKALAAAGAAVADDGGQSTSPTQSSTPENALRNGLQRGSGGTATTAATGQSTQAAASQTQPASGGSEDLGPMPEGVDPRKSGFQYFILCSTLEANALKVVAFCRARGLDAFVVPDQNGRLREVTVLPGFGPSERSSPAIRELEERIRRVGVLWKASGPGNSDFGDRYIKTHK